MANVAGSGTACRRVGRWVLNVAAGVSAVLFVAAAGMWVRGEFVWDEVVWTRVGGGGGSPRAEVRQGVVDGGPRGSLTVSVSRNTHDVSDPAVAARFRSAWAQYGEWRHVTAAPAGEGLRLRGGPEGWGFRWETTGGDDLSGRGYGLIGSYRTVVSVPWWFLMLVFAVAPARWVRRWGRERREGVEGRCRGCGYDLRATPERCPECGLGVGRRD